jgi:hypothetical protein
MARSPRPARPRLPRSRPRCQPGGPRRPPPRHRCRRCRQVWRGRRWPRRCRLMFPLLHRRCRQVWRGRRWPRRCRLMFPLLLRRCRQVWRGRRWPRRCQRRVPLAVRASFPAPAQQHHRLLCSSPGRRRLQQFPGRARLQRRLRPALDLQLLLPHPLVRQRPQPLPPLLLWLRLVRGFPLRLRRAALLAHLRRAALLAHLLLVVRLPPRGRLLRLRRLVRSALWCPRLRLPRLRLRSEDRRCRQPRWVLCRHLRRRRWFLPRRRRPLCLRLLRFPLRAGQWPRPLLLRLPLQHRRARVQSLLLAAPPRRRRRLGLVPLRRPRPTPPHRRLPDRPQRQRHQRRAPRQRRQQRP